MVRAYRTARIREALARRAGRAGEVDIESSLALLDLQTELETAAPGPPPLTRATARARLEAGMPLVDPETAVPPAALDRARERIRALVVRRRPELADEPAADPAIATLALQTVLRPWAAALAPLVDEDRWRRGTCPVCGGAPDLAAIGRGHERRLLCSRCDATWAYPRIGCPFCGAQDPAQVGYYPVPDRPYRLYVCDACRGYLKAVELTRDGPACPPADRFLAAPLDRAAARLGYADPAVRSAV